MLCSLSLYHEVGFIQVPEEWRTSVPGGPPSFSCKEKGPSYPFQPTRWYALHTYTLLSLTIIEPLLVNWVINPYFTTKDTEVQRAQVS